MQDVLDVLNEKREEQIRKKNNLNAPSQESNEITYNEK